MTSHDDLHDHRDACYRAGAADALAVVANQREAFLESDSLDPAWIAGWHAAIDYAAHQIRAALAERNTP